MDLIELIFHVDRYLENLLQLIGDWAYVVLFLIIFSETGLVVTPFLPGDSLLFAVGALAARGMIDPWIASIVMSIAAVLGNVANYHIGRFVGPKVFSKEGSLFFNRKHLDTAHAFYERHGAKAVVIARFLPIFRTFVPFVAGIGRMSYGKFTFYNTFGSLLWTFSFIWVGYHFGNLPFVRKHFSMVIVGIIIVSFLPTFIKLFGAIRRKLLISESKRL
ncbi:MAG: VTT domain-containing protein [Syntrophobacterales bacterium]|nr:VTT domain-containing protein [Syntrophobacterales bacterium]